MATKAQDLHAILAAHRDELLSMQNVVGVGIGIKEKGGRPTGEMAISVLVTEKVPRTQLRYAVPRLLAREYCTDVIAVGELRLLAEVDRLERSRPANPGVSIGHHKITAGTLGAVVLDNESGNRLVLSNNHVLANMTNGTDNRASIGDHILQPGAYDGGTVPGDVIGQLLRYVPLYREVDVAKCETARQIQRLANLCLMPVRPEYELRFFRTTAQQNVVDAAVAGITSLDVVAPEILGIGIPQGTADAEPGMAVVKSGRTTGVTEGTIRATDVTVRIQLGDLGAGVFTDQVITTPMAQPGDSGSLVLTKDSHRAVGLLSAGSDQATVFGKWKNVSDLLNVRLLTS